MINQLKKCLLATSIIPLILMAGCQTAAWQEGENNFESDGVKVYAVIDQSTTVDKNKEQKYSFSRIKLLYTTNDNNFGPSSNNKESCYSTISFQPDKPLKDEVVRSGEFEILFLNFTKSGRLETYSINANHADGKMFKAIIDKAIQDGHNYYELAQNLADEPRNRKSFKQRNMGNAPRPDLNRTRNSDKYTPLYLYHEDKKRKALLYVLFDEHVRFNETQGNTIISSLPSSTTPLYSPYFISDPIYTGNNGKNKVLLVDFYRGGDIAKRIKDYASATADVKAKNVLCPYPYDLGLIMRGQSGNKNETPIFVDPENESKGPPP